LHIFRFKRFGFCYCFFPFLKAGNTFVQGRNKENHAAFITVAPEGVANPSQGLIVENNTGSLAPGAPWSTVFVADWSHEPLVIRNNKLGKGLTVSEQF